MCKDTFCLLGQNRKRLASSVGNDLKNFCYLPISWIRDIKNCQYSLSRSKFMFQIIFGYDMSNDTNEAWDKSDMLAENI